MRTKTFISENLSAAGMQPLKRHFTTTLQQPVSIFGINSILYKNSLFVPFFTVKDIAWFENNYTPDDNDVFIVTYPKCGTTWVAHICYEIMRCYNEQQQSKYNNNLHSYYSRSNTKEKSPIYENQYIWSRSQSIENFNEYIAATKNTLRFWKIHAPKRIFPMNKPFEKWNHKKYKIIIVARNPKDACVSYYYHQKNIDYKEAETAFNADFSLFFTLWISGLVRNDNWFSWYKEWYDIYMDKDNQLSKKIHWMYYEDLNCDHVESKRNQVRNLMKFLDLENMDRSDGAIDGILNATNFKKMKKDFDSRKGFPIKNFIRKGIVGDWKNHFNLNESKIIDHLIMLNFHHQPSFKYYNDLMHKKQYLASKL